MRIENTINGMTCVIVRQHTMDRLRNTCFRGTTIACAGNFFQWPTIFAFFYSEDVQHEIWMEMLEVGVKGLNQTHSFEIEFDDFVGWSSTDDLCNYIPNELEEFHPNRHSKALKVKGGLEVVPPAPKTKIVTVIYELKREDGQLVAVIHSIYPGHDIGELHGDVSIRERVVFFDWTHPGQK